MSVTFSLANTSGTLLEFTPGSLLEILGTIHGCEMNLSNSNARKVAQLVGIELETEDELCGTLTGMPELIESCDKALALLAIDGMDAAKAPSQVTVFGMTGVDLGHRDGYLSEKVTDLKTLAEMAVKFEAVISYY